MCMKWGEYSMLGLVVQYNAAIEILRTHSKVLINDGTRVLSSWGGSATTLLNKLKCDSRITDEAIFSSRNEWCKSIALTFSHNDLQNEILNQK